MRKFTKHPSQHKQVNSSTDTTRIPVPYNKYFEIDPPTRDADLLPGDRIEDYDCTFLAYLAPKPEYEDTLDMWPVLTDLTDYPVCDLVAGRLYPITPEDIHRHLGDTEYLVESSTSTKQFTKHPKKVTSSQDVDDYEDDIREISQEFTSENTSINSGKLPAIFKLIHLAPGTINIDYGGGKFDNVAEYLAPMDVVNLVYDPYNRTPEHNREVIRTIKKAGGADSATCSNVLNVIKEPEVRRNVLENIRRVVKPEGVVYITVYEGSGRGNEGPTKSGYQLNRKTADYLAEIQEVFPDAMRKGKLIIAHPNGSITSSVECATDGTHVPVPYDKYFEIEQPNEDASYMPGDEIENYDCHFLAYLAPKEKYEDDLSFYPVLTDDPDYPVCELVGGRLYPVGIDDIERMLNIYDDESSTIMSASSISMKAIHDKLLNAASKRMQKSDMGFPLSEIADYLIVEEEETEDGALKIEVRCELDYNGMRKLAEVLDPIVARYDKNAYFDMVAPGIMEAFIFNKKVTADTAAPIDASVYDFPELPLEPPDYDDPEENESVEYITIDLDDDIIVEVDTVDFVGSPKFEKDEADWVVDEYPSIQLDYSESVAENVLDLLLPQLPAEPGTYRVRGRIHLAYDVMVPVYYESYGPDDEEYIVDDDNVEIDFNYKKSSIENIEVGKD